MSTVANTFNDLPIPIRTAGVSALRLNLLRAGYFLIAAGMGTQIWPLMIHHAGNWSLMHGVANSMLAALTALCLLGIRYPLKMLPLLFFEMFWKAAWLIAIALPLWTAHRVDADTAETVKACLLGIIFPIIMPWRYVFADYVRAAGERWR